MQEDALTRLRRDWDRAEGVPQYYTTPLEPSETLRLIPAPLHTGSATPVDPPRVITGAVEGNLVVWRWLTPPEVTAGEFPLPEVLEDVVVFMTVAALKGGDNEFHDKAGAQAFDTLARLTLQALMGGLS